MAIDKTTLKNWFKTGLKPTQAQFWAWMDSYWHKDEKITISSIDGLGDAIDGKADANHSHDTYARNDASSLNTQDIISWQQTLGIDNLEMSDTSIATTIAYDRFGLPIGSTIRDFNNKVFDELEFKLTKPTENATEEFVLLADGSTAPKTDFGKVDTVMGVQADANKNVDISAVPMVWTNASHRFSAIPNKSSDATYNQFMLVDTNGNIGKADNAYNALYNSFNLMTPTQKVALFSLMNGQYSTGQITTSIVINPLIAKEDRIEGTIQVKIIGKNLSINPDISHVRIKEVGNLTNFSDCTFTNDSSSMLHVDVPLGFIEENKSYVFEIKHGIQLHTTNSSISVVNFFEEIDVNSLTYTKQIRNIEGTLGTAYTDANLEGQTIVHRVIKSANSTAFNNAVSVKHYTNKIFDYDDEFIVTINFNVEAYSTSALEFPRQWDYVGLAKVQSDYTAVTNNMVSGSATGYQSLNGNDRRQSIFGATGNYISKSGSGQLIIVKKGNLLTTILYMNGSILNYSSNATSSDLGYNLEFNFVGRYLSAKDVSQFTVVSLQKVVSI